MDQKDVDQQSVEEQENPDSPVETSPAVTDDVVGGCFTIIFTGIVLILAFVFRAEILNTACYFDLSVACVLSADLYTDNDEMKLEKYVNACNGKWVWKEKGCYKAGLMYEKKSINSGTEDQSENLLKAHLYYKMGCPDYGDEDEGACLKLVELKLLFQKEEQKADLYEKGYAKYEQKDYNGAIVDLSELIKISPNDPHAYNLRGISKSELGKYESAIEDYNKVIELLPDNHIGYYNRALSLIFLDRFEDAKKDYETAKKLKLDDFAVNNLPIMGLILEQKYDEAKAKVKELKDAGVEVDTDYEKILSSKFSAPSPIKL
ncbi:MAG TPA: tetratricopeptide repeat protein [bacterium]|nr:tetratricopeptide repeat protein [bacterium]HPM48194.1 tetratricopeptide repeat protein [bacterium]